MTHLQEALNELRESIVEMADLVGRQLGKSVTALLEGDDDLANEVIAQEKRVNAYELKIDEDCEHIFALLSPVAHDMRFVFSSLKINSDLERIGDYAEGIAKLVLLGRKDFDTGLVERIGLSRMYAIGRDMLTDVTKAYYEGDSKLARSIFSRDLQMDEINRNATAIVVEFSRAHPDKMEQALYLLSIVRVLERAGDHMTNIAEDIIFYKEAKQLKHGRKGDSNGER